MCKVNISKSNISKFILYCFSFASYSEKTIWQIFITVLYPTLWLYFKRLKKKIRVKSIVYLVYFCPNNNIRELAEWFKATSLKLVKTKTFHGFKSHTLWTIL